MYCCTFLLRACCYAVATTEKKLGCCVACCEDAFATWQLYPRAERAPQTRSVLLYNQALNADSRNHVSPCTLPRPPQGRAASAAGWNATSSRCRTSWNLLPCIWNPPTPKTGQWSSKALAELIDKIVKGKNLNEHRLANRNRLSGQ